MPNSAKSWCVHPCHNIIDPITGEKKFVKKGRNPTHPCGIHRIDAATAAYINWRNLSVEKLTTKQVQDGDKICTNCLRKISKEKGSYDEYEIYAIESMNVDEAESLDYDNNDKKVINESSHTQDNSNVDELPSSQEQKQKKEEIRIKLNTIFQLFDIEPIRDIRRTKNIRQKVYDACSIMYQLCDTILQPKDESIDQQLSIKDTDTLLFGLRILFKESTDSEQIRLLTISPDSWGRKMIQQWFDCSDYQARQALLLRKSKGLLAYPDYFYGNKPITDATIYMVRDFYVKDGISRVSPRKKDIIHINKLPVPVRFMEITIREAFEAFIIENPSIAIGKSSFNALRPREVKCNTQLDTCLCIYHENMDLMLKGLNKYLKSNSIEQNNDFEAITYKYLFDRIVCGNSTESCFLGECSMCCKINPSDILQEENNINFDENTCWSQWKTLNNNLDLVQLNGSYVLLLNEIDSQWNSFLRHSYFTVEQREYIKNLRLNSTDKTYIVCQLDFAENFSIFYQREVQGFHWSNKQVTIFTVHLKIGSMHRNIAIISDYMSHNTSFVFVAQELIIQFVKKYFPLVKRINYLSDGASSHFKNNYNIFNLTYHKDDFGLEAAWTFTSTAHGKGPCDGVGAAVKYTATRSISTSGTVISSAEEFYEFTKKFNEDAAKISSIDEPPIHTFYIKSSTVDRIYDEILKPRWDKLGKNHRVKQLRSFHQFNIRSDRTVVYRHTSNSLDYKTFMYSNKDKSEPSVDEIHSLNQLHAGMFIVINDQDETRVCRIKLINHLTHEVQVQYYEPPFPGTIFYVSRLNSKSNVNIHVQNIILSLRYSPVIGGQDEIYLNAEQFMDIKSICDEL